LGGSFWKRTPVYKLLEFHLWNCLAILFTSIIALIVRHLSWRLKYLSVPHQILRTLCSILEILCGPINVGNPGEYPIKELAEKIQSTVNPSVSVSFKPRPSDDPTRRQPDISKVREFLS
jgi:hypothetical protein